MIKTPVTRHDVFTSSFVDKFGSFLDGNEIDDAEKRINMHNDLVNSLRDMVEIVGSNFCSNIETKCKYKQARKLLEKFK
jgi:hypothetical protein